MDSRASLSHWADRCRFGVRFSQWPARCGELHRNDCLDPGPASAICGVLGRLLQLRRLSVLWPECRPNRRNGHNHARYHRRSCNLRRIDGRDQLESVDLGSWHTVVQLACADRRASRRWNCQSRHRHRRLERLDQDGLGRRVLSGLGLRPGPVSGSCGVMDFCAEDSACGRQYFSLPPIRLRLVLFPRPRRQRRAEDDGDHRRATLFARQARRRISRPLLGRVELSDGHGARHPFRRLADRPHHGLENYQTDPDAGLLR